MFSLDFLTMNKFNEDSRSFTREQIANLKIERDKLQTLQNQNIQRQQILLDDVSMTEDLSRKALVIVK